MARIGENLAVCDGELVCMRCDTALTGEGGQVVETMSPLAKAGPWIALRWDGDSPNFLLREIACPDCGTLHAVSEVRK
jgi:DNA-directed RNA polymerase subunit RPC12/RpoP